MAIFELAKGPHGSTRGKRFLAALTLVRPIKENSVALGLRVHQVNAAKKMILTTWHKFKAPGNPFENGTPQAHLYSIGVARETIDAAEKNGQLVGATLEGVMRHFPPHISSAEKFNASVKEHASLLNSRVPV